MPLRSDGMDHQTRWRGPYSLVSFPISSPTPLPPFPLQAHLFPSNISLQHWLTLPPPSSHCDACKLLSGGESTLNQMASEGDLKITKGSTKTYTYYGDSGTSTLSSLSFLLQQISPLSLTIEPTLPSQSQRGSSANPTPLPSQKQANQ